jgi:hypothetical protein
MALTKEELDKLKEMQELMQAFRQQIEPVKIDFQMKLNELPWGGLITIIKFEGKNKQKFTVKALDEEFTINITRKVEVDDND